MKKQDFSLFDNLIEGIQVIDRSYKYVYVNDALAKQIRIKKEDLLGFRLLERFPILEKSYVLTEIKECMTQRKVGQIIENYHFLDGTKTWFELKIQPYEDGLFIMSTDITKQKEAEALAIQKENSYRQLFDKLSEGFIIRKAVKDDTGKVVDLIFLALNEPAAKVIGLPREEIIGKLRSEVLGTLGGRSLEVANEVLLEGKTIRYENKYNRLNRWVLITSYSPEPDIMASFVVDITPQKKYELELKKLNEQLEINVYDRTIELTEALEREKRISTQKSTFISMASHELSTPLASIKLCVEVLEKLNTTPNQAERKEYHGFIKEEAENLLGMINTFLFPKSRKSDRVLSLKKEFNLAVLFQNLVKELGEMCKLGQQIVYQHHGQKLVYLDKGILRRIVLNLLSNAIKYSEKDIQIITQVQSDIICLEIIDQGIGIPENRTIRIVYPIF